MKNYLIKILIVCILLPGNTIVSKAQIDNLFFTQNYRDLPWGDFTDSFENTHNIRFYYNSDSLLQLRVNFEKSNVPASTQIKSFLKDHGYEIQTYEANIFITKNQRIYTQLPDNFHLSRYYGFPDSQNDTTNYLSREAKYIPRVRTVGTKENDRKKTAVFSGYLRNSYDGKPVSGAVMQITETEQTTVSDAKGFYSFSLPKGTYTLKIRSVEVEPAEIEVHLLSDGSLNIELNRQYIAIDEVMISSEAFHNVRSTQLGFDKLSVAKTAEIPSSIGENDIVKAGLLLPGVKSSGEGNSGISVRGSPTDQNMFYLDRIPVYNSSHFLGFFSSFNATALSDFTLYKSSIPAEYGGSLAAVAEIKAKEANREKFSAAGGISPIAANIQVEGPIIKDKAAAMLSFRSGYSNQIFELFDNPVLNKSSASFMDLVGKISLDLNQKNKIKIPIYYSSDNSNLSGDKIYDYRTTGIGLEWNRIIADKHSLSTNLAYSDYSFTEENRSFELNSYKLPYQLKHYEITSKINIKLPANHRLTPGINGIIYDSRPGTIIPANESSQVQPISFDNEQASLLSIFITDQWKPFKKLNIQASFRMNYYSLFGPGTSLQYSETGLYTADNIQDTTRYDRFETIAGYWHPDYRISANFAIIDNLSIKAGISNMQQYIFMLSNTLSPSPVNKWKLADEHLKPMQGKQYSGGIYANIPKAGLEFSAEAYYKNVTGYKDFKDGADLVFTPVSEWAIIDGNLDAYGIEFMLKKSGGRISGWVNYSYSRAIVQTQSSIPEQQANFGKAYPANYDKPHAFNFVGSYRFGRRFSISANLVYSSGRPLTYPSSIYYINKSQMLNYSERNAFRIPYYFRADVSAKFEGNLKADKKAHGTWVLSVYNLTGRDNAYSIFFRNEDGLIRSYQMSIFAVPIITLSYQFKLGNYADKYF